MPPAEPPKNIFQHIAAWVVDLVDWLEKNLADPALASRLLADLGLNPSSQADPPSVGAGSRQNIEQFQKDDVDELALAATLKEVIDILETVWAFVEAAKSDAVDTSDLVHLLFRVWVADSLRVRNPSAFALCQLVGLITSDEETLDQLDPASFLRIARGEAEPGEADLWIDRISALAGSAVVLLDAFWPKLGSGIDAFYGWDPGPGDDPNSANAASRALTVILHGEDVDIRPALTLIGVHSIHGGQAGLLLSLSAHVVHSEEIGKKKVTFDAGGNGPFSLFVPFELTTPRPMAGLNPSLELRVEPTDQTAGKPTLVMGATDASRLEIAALGTAIRLDSDSAGLKLSARGGKLVIELSKTDGFLRQLPGGRIEVPFDLGVLLDTSDGLRFDGGSGLKVNLPVSASLFGAFTIQYLELELKLEDPVSITVFGGFSLRLGPFQATVDRTGLEFNLAKAGQRRGLDKLVSFAPPRGIGLVLDAGPVKGGGYLFIDAEKGEYAGALELTLVEVFSIKAIAIITTKGPGGRDEWSLLIAIYGQFMLHIAFGIFLSGVGGLIALNRDVDADKLSSGLKSGVLDDILFPANPVADAPRIVNRFREVFPVTPGVETFALMLQLSFSKPPIVYANIGVIFGGSDPKVILIGQVLVQLPPRDLKVPAIVKLTIDVLGLYDAERAFLLIRAKLRDSYVGIEGLTKIDLSGDLLIIMQFGGNPSFVLSAGGFHPSFKDVPCGTPTDLDRIGASFRIGLLKIQAEMYLAVTSNSVQAGFKVTVKASIEVASIQGSLSFDAIVHLSPRFRFLVDLVFNVALRAFGRSLASVEVRMSLEGPGAWRAKGSFSFSILWWDEDIGFDESWGSAAAIDPGTVNCRQQMLAELRDPAHLEPGPPVGGRSLVSVAPSNDSLAHPLGHLDFRQKVAPMGVQVDRIGTMRLEEGPTTFSISEVTVGGVAFADPEPVKDHFARGMFMEMSEEQKLSGQSFEHFDAGVRIGSDTYRVPNAGTKIDAGYERAFLEPHTGVSSEWSTHRPGARHLLDFDVARDLVQFGASARSNRTKVRRMLDGGIDPATVRVPELAVVDQATLAPMGGTAVERIDSPTLAESAAALSGGIVVERFEVFA